LGIISVVLEKEKREEISRFMHIGLAIVVYFKFKDSTSLA
jgi:hypothetical protein